MNAILSSQIQNNFEFVTIIDQRSTFSSLLDDSLTFLLIVKAEFKFSYERTIVFMYCLFSSPSISLFSVSQSFPKC